MTKNLFFREYITNFDFLLSTGRWNGRKVILFFLLFINFFKATALEVLPPANNSQVAIYLSGSAQVYESGKSSVITIKVKSNDPLIIPSKINLKEQPSQIQIATVAKKDAYKKLTDKIELVRKQIFYTSNSKANLKNLYLYRIGVVAISNTVYTTLKCGTEKVSEINLLPKYIAQVQKQKFYTSLSYLQFEKYSSTSLRGPPHF